MKNEDEGYKNTGNLNTGDKNTGSWNTGNWNTGNWNTGDWNTGYKNTGDWNTGNCNTGDWNTGNWNTGDWNAGYKNTGDCNTGDWNTGNCNTGNSNTGNWNTGNSNTGNWNTGDWNTGYFNSHTPKEIDVFNKKCTLEKWNNAKKPNWFFVDLCVWINEGAMSDDEKDLYPSYVTCGGYLKCYNTLFDAYKESWEKTTEEDRQLTKQLPNYDPLVFKEVFGFEPYFEKDE